MHRRADRATRHPGTVQSFVAVCALTVVAIAVMPSRAHAQAPAAASAPMAVDLPAQPLERALPALAQQLGVPLVADAALLRDKAAPALKGSFTPQQALQRLLAATGLAAKGEQGVFVVNLAPAPVAEPTRKPVAPTAAASSGLPAIVVTGERTSRRLDQTRSSIGVITAGEAEQRAQQNVYEALTGIANVTVVGGDGLPALRGQQNNPVGSLGGAILSGVEPRSALIVDDFARSPSWPNVAYTSMFDVDQVEVLRGPQSTLRGRNAMSGAFVVRTADPTFSFEGRALAEVTHDGSSGTGSRAAAAVSGPLIDDTLAGRLVLERKRDNDPIAGFISGPGVGYSGAASPADARRIETDRVQGKLLWRPDGLKGLSVTLLGTRVDGTVPLYRNAVAGPANGVQFADRLAFGSDYRVVDTTSRFGGTKLNYDAGELGRFELLLGYGQDSYQSDSDRDSSGVVFSRSTDSLSTTELVWRFGAPDAKVSGLAGVSYIRRTSDLNALAFTSVPVLADTRTKTTGAYADLTLRVTDQLELNGGGRIQSARQTRNFTFGAPVITDEHLDDTVLLPELGATYRLNAGQSLGLSLRKGYNDGGRALNNTLFTSYSFSPESVWTSEASYRLLSDDRRLSLAATAFYNRFRNQQFSVLIDTTPVSSETANQPRSRSYGLELEARWRPLPALTLSGSLGLLKTEITEVSATNVAAGNPFGLDPRVTASTGLEWQADERFTFDGRLSYVGHYYADPTATAGLEGGDYLLADLGASARIGRATLRLFVQNLGNKLAVVSRYNDVTATVLKPRTVGVTLSADF